MLMDNLLELSVSELHDLQIRIRKAIESKKSNILSRFKAECKEEIAAIKADLRRIGEMLDKEYTIEVTVQIPFKIDIEDSRPFLDMEHITSIDDDNAFRKAQTKYRDKLKEIKTLWDKADKAINSLAKKYKIDSLDVWDQVDPAGYFH